MERSQVLRWRLGWLPGEKPRPCPFHPTANLSRTHATNCLQIHSRLQLPESIQDPLSFLLNLLPLKNPTNAQYSASWAVRWPAICLILYELDHIFHNEEIPLAPPNISTLLVEWLQR
ncbi:hypothetical protein [Parasitella parasitica]|uniref:Ndc10 domain-containing protein n=1 Tax=Parasitella parasitica TaxID=35722 RepID=A0A0B7NGQ3_9FUNG|nr:hypothetical protein [Parasitella parasitica]